MKISFLIPTHNRVNLFQRALNSILNLVPKKLEYEIIVNDDVGVISKSKNYKLLYFKSNDLSDIYKNLFENAKGEYIYYLEDDDILLSSFFDVFNENYNFDFSINSYLHHKNKIIKPSLENVDFQLSQVIFKKSAIKHFPQGNILDNDYKLLINNLTDNYIITKKVIFKQTTDGKDNISFKCFNKDKRFETSATN